MRSTKICYSIVLLLTGLSTTAQNPTSIEEKQISPLSPNAASLGQYGNVPVSLYTGIPNIQIPIYEINVRDFSLPISLSYHAGGVKVEDVPSWVGMGWTLNAGGMISRQMKGIVDERMIDKKGDYASEIATLFDDISTSGERAAAIDDLMNGNYDTQSDIYSISAGGLSQKFFLDDDGNPYCLPANKLKIEHEGSIDFQVNYIDEQFARWKVTDKKGIQYIFGRSLDIIDNTSWDGIELYIMEANCNGWSAGNVVTSGDPWFVSSWYLSEIILPTGESIDFAYETLSFCIQQNLKGLHAVGIDGSLGNGGGILEEGSSGGMNYIQALRLKEITFPTGKIEFLINGDNRRDIEGTVILEKIRISSLESGVYQELKSFVLDTTNPDGNVVMGDDDFRLALLSVQETDKNGNTLPSHVFEYENDNSSDFGLPSRLSMAQDLWGFYNGQNSNVNLLPTYIYRDDLGQMLYYVERSNRSVSPLHAKYGTLKKITYPTGGTTSFSYESNIARGATDPSDPASENPLIKLANMEIAPLTSQLLGATAENTDGTDEGFSSTFQIFKATEVDVTANIMGGSIHCDTLSHDGGASFEFPCFTVSFEEETSPENFSTINSSVYFYRSYSFDPGIYRVKIKWTEGDSLINEYARVSLSWDDFVAPAPSVIDETTEMIVGGLRVSKIVDYDPASQKEIIRQFSYDFNEEDVQIRGTSGTIMNAPLNYYQMNQYIYQDGIPDGGPNPADLPTTLLNAHIITSYSNSAILQTNGGYVGYKKVSIDYGENADGGRSSSYFLTAEDYIDGNLANAQEWPFPPVVNYDWKRGLLEKEVQYKFSSGLYTPIKTTLNDYQFNESPSDINYKSLPQIKIAKIPSTGSDFTGVDVIYNTIRESSYQSESIAVQHSSAGDLSTVTTFTQDDKSLGVASIMKTSSDEKSIKTVFKYPDDYNDIENIDSLKANNIIANPVKVETSVDNIQTGGVITKYNDHGQPLEVYSYENELLSTTAPHDPAVMVPSNYVRKFTYSYDSTSHLFLEGKPENGRATSYIWAYDKMLPVAKIQNATWTEVLLAVSNLTPTFLDDLNASSDQTDIDNKLAALRTEVNTDIPEALITSYTHDPIIGMTSQTDPNGITTYYEYDDFGRIKHIKDHQGNLLTNTAYHYKGQ